jgi:hypothetical protein
MKTKSAILILTAASLLTGCGSLNSEMKDSSAVDIAVEVSELELCTDIAETADTLLFTTAATSTSETTTTTSTTTTTATTTTVTEAPVVETEPITEAPTEPEPVYVAAPVETETEPVIQTDAPATGENVCPVTGITLQYTNAYCIYESPLTRQAGVVYYGGHKETYYSENVLPGPGLSIPDRHHGDDGTIRDADGYICVATDYSFLPYGSIIVTSLGPGKVYDTGCAWGTVDIYTCW